MKDVNYDKVPTYLPSVNVGGGENGRMEEGKGRNPSLSARGRAVCSVNDRSLDGGFTITIDGEYAYYRQQSGTLEFGV